MKYFLPALVLLFSFRAFAQQPPLLNTYTYTHTDWMLNVCVDYQPNDTGTILVQFQLAAEETGNIVLDQYFNISSTQDTGCFNMLLPYNCTDYIVTMNMSNSHAYGPIQNPLFSFKAGCTSSVVSVDADKYNVTTADKTITIQSAQLTGAVKADVFDLTGRKLAEALISNTQQNIFIAEQPGLYIVRISDAAGIGYTTKVAIR